jgi:DNA repair protein RecN (Recombination protein N)
MVGERLARLAQDTQVIVVTHSPQVAARAGHHWLIVKQAQGGTSRTTVKILDAGHRREEIARMLAGAKITDEARAAADSLLQAAGS